MGVEGLRGLTPSRLPLVGLVLGAGGPLLGRLVLTVLPPLLQLEVDEFPHHPGLREADSRQARHPTEERNQKVPKVQHLCVNTCGSSSGGKKERSSGNRKVAGSIPRLLLLAKCS